MADHVRHDVASPHRSASAALGRVVRTARCASRDDRRARWSARRRQHAPRRLGRRSVAAAGDPHRDRDRRLAALARRSDTLRRRPPLACGGRSDARPLPLDPPQPRSGGSYDPRAALRVPLAAPGGPLAVVNTHLDASGDDRWRRQEIRTVIAIVDSLRSRGVPTLAGGDINSTPESEVQATARGAGLRDAWSAWGAGGGLTYRAGSAVKRNDYLYLTGSATCSHAAVVTSQASDHRPVLFVVRNW